MLVSCMHGGEGRRKGGMGGGGGRGEGGRVGGESRGTVWNVSGDEQYGMRVERDSME